MRARILFVSHTADRGGPTTSLALLIEHLRERFEMGVAVPHRGSLTDRLDRLAIPYYVLGPLKKYAVPALVRTIRTFDASLVYANNTSSSSENALIAARVAGVPFVCHVRGMSNRRGRRRLAFLRFADAVIAVSRAAARSVAPHAGGRPVYVIHNGIDAAAPLPDRTAARGWLERTFGLEPASVVAVGVAHITPRKAQHHAIRAWPRVLDACADAHLLLAGAHDREPDYVASLHAMIGEARLGHRARLVGLRDDVDRFLAAADLFVHTAVADPHPRAVIEAMAAGLPVVAFAVDGVAETVRDGRTGRLVDPRNEDALATAVAALANDPAARRRMAEEGRRDVARRFSARETARRVGAVIDDVLHRRAGRAWAGRRRAVAGPLGASGVE